MLIFLNISKKEILVTTLRVKEQMVKKIERSLGSCETDTGDVFTKGSMIQVVRIFCNSLRKLKIKVVKINEVANTTRKSQI